MPCGLLADQSAVFTVYVLKSLRNSKRYVGFTSKIEAERLREHNSGVNHWTRSNKPFRLVHTEIFGSKTEAIRREKFLKSGQGRKFLDNLFGGDKTQSSAVAQW